MGGGVVFSFSSLTLHIHMFYFRPYHVNMQSLVSRLLRHGSCFQLVFAAPGQPWKLGSVLALQLFSFCSI